MISHVVAAAIRWMMLALVAFAGVAITGRGAAQGLPVIDIMFYRGWLGLVIMVMAWYAAGRQLTDIHTKRPGLVCVRSATHFVAQFAWLQALAMIPLAELISIEFTAPLWTALLAPLALGERMTAARLAAAALGFCGILVVVRPGSLEIGPGTIFAFVAALGFAFHYITARLLMRTDGAFELLFLTTLLQAIMATFFVIGSLQVPTPATAAWVAGLTAIGLVAHYSLTRAFSHADAIIVAPMDFIRLPLLALVGAVFYGEKLDPMLALGATIIVAANFLNLWGERLRRPRAASTSKREEPS